MPKGNYLSLNAMDKILRRGGAYRVSDDAKEALAEILHQKGLEIAAAAAKMASHAGRRTLTRKDIDMVTK